jgi:Dyp-type peroxidase family
MTVRLEDEPLLDAADIQGNSLRGFDTKYLDLVGFKIENAAKARSWLRTLPIFSTEAVHEHRMRRSALRPAISNRVLINAAFSKFGLDTLGFNTSQVEDGFFKKPMGSLAGALGDRVENGQPIDYVLGKAAADTPDVLLLIGSDDDKALTAQTASILSSAAEAGLHKFYSDRGNVLPDEIEHFGFRDGISAPGPRGLLTKNPPTPLTRRLIDPGDPAADLFGKPGQPLIWPGQFIFGYPTQSATDPRTPQPPRQGPKWMENGSLLVLRRLRQDVALFREFLSATSTVLSKNLGHTITAAQLGALIVGRWTDGTPVILSPKPEASISGDDMRRNHFAYGGLPDIQVLVNRKSETIPGHPADVEGSRCPHFAHIRKVNPRDQRTNKGEGEFTQLFQMLRRGIPYGCLYDEKPEAERGLLFLAYQTSFTNQFRELNTDWMNNPDAPELGNDGYDLLVGQSGDGTARIAPLHDAIANVDVQITAPAQFVVPTGGAFLFSPSISFFRGL